MSAPTDLLVVGAGIIGLAHAYEAHRRGLSVRIVERDLAPNGASIRNFGHACITAQAGDLLPVAYRSREGWLRAAEDVGFWAPTAGAVVVARSALELGVLEELHAQRGSDAVALLTPEGCGRDSDRVPTRRSSAARSCRRTCASTRGRRRDRSRAGSSRATA